MGNPSGAICARAVSASPQLHSRREVSIQALGKNCLTNSQCGSLAASGCELCEATRFA